MLSRFPLVDTHCHLDASRFDEDREAVLSRAWEAGLEGIVVPAVGPHDWEPLIELPAKDARLQIGLGIHPQLLPALPESEDDAHLERLDELLARGVACAVGECGIDKPSVPGASMERQVRVLERHFELARKHGLPVIVHCFRAHPTMVELMKRVALPEAGVLMHSYSGGPDLAKFYLERGCYFAFAGPVSFQEARKPLAALEVIPLERLMVETDSPDQAPHPHRGKRSEPAFLPFIAAAMARHLGVSDGALAQQTTETARKLFRRPFGAESR